MSESSHDRVGCNPTVVVSVPFMNEDGYTEVSGCTTMMPLYIMAAILGGGLVLVSIFAGSDHDHDHEFSADHDADHGGIEHGDLWIPFLSLRFWTYFLMAAGVTGILLMQFAQTVEPITAFWASGTGLVVGLGVSYVMHLAKKMQTEEVAQSADFLGREATVIVPIRPNLDGKIRVEVKGQLIELLALPFEEREIARDEIVVIVSMDNDRARVIPRDDLLENQNHA